MPTTNGNRQILDLKKWEFCAPAPNATAAGAFVVSSRHFRQQQMYVRANTEAYMYNPSEDGWVTLPSPGLAGTFGAGASGTAGAWSTGSTVGVASLTATAGTTSTITTNQTLARDLRGYKILIMAGPNNGLALDIVSNTIGANAVITVATQASAFSASTVYRLLTPRFYVVGAGTLAAASFRVYDYATNTWTTLSQTGLPASIGTDGRLVATPSMIDGAFKQFATGTATSATGTTLTQTGKTWTASQWINSQVRITGGTGAGQIRTITANTADTLTVATWTTNPDATSTYAIEGNDNFLYYLGNNAVTMYRYDIAANTWSTLSPTAARAGAPGAGTTSRQTPGFLASPTARTVKLSRPAPNTRCTAGGCISRRKRRAVGSPTTSPVMNCSLGRPRSIRRARRYLEIRRLMSSTRMARRRSSTSIYCSTPPKSCSARW